MTATGTAARIARISVGTAAAALTVVTPALLAWAGVRLLADELASRQPDGDLEAGGGFALAVLLVELVLAAYLVAAVTLGLLWSRGAGRPIPALGVVALASGAVVVTGVALSWR